MAKPKRGSSGGPKKAHGPKKHLFRALKPMVHTLSSDGNLNKYYSYESWCLACTARGKKDISKSEFNKFVMLKTCKEKDAYYKSLRK